MVHFHGRNKKKSYFEGWYLKHTKEDKMIGFIPAFHINPAGQSYASIQVITKDSSYIKYFSESDFFVSTKKFYCKIGKNEFSEKGIKIHLEVEGIKIKGELTYGRLQPLASDIMGPFRYFPMMQCNHGVLSLFHKLKGHLSINDKMFDFTDGIGYIEKDWGTSFPSSYVWTQCNWTDKGNKAVMLSIADVPVPVLKKSITGCICVVFYEGREYRLATYLGVRILHNSEKKIILRQGCYRLEVRLIREVPFSLQAPVEGSMIRKVNESPVSTVIYRFLRKNKVLFEKISENAGFERGYSE